MSPLLRRLKSHGFADLGEFDPSMPSGIVARDIANAIGAAHIAEPEGLRVSLPGSKELNTYGGNFGLDALPLHTDLAHWHRPPRYVMLRCVVGSPSVSTRVLHHRDLETQVPVALMRRALFGPRRRLEGKMYLLRMLTDDIFRWDQLFLVPKNQPAIEAQQLMLDSAERVTHAQIALDKPGRTLLIDNWQVLHGRSAVPISEAGRRLERTYMEDITNGHEDTT